MGIDYAEASYFEGYAFSHIVRYLDHKRTRGIIKKHGDIVRRHGPVRSCA